MRSDRTSAGHATGLLRRVSFDSSRPSRAQRRATCIDGPALDVDAGCHALRRTRRRTSAPRDVRVAHARPVTLRRATVGPRPKRESVPRHRHRSFLSEATVGRPWGRAVGRRSAGARHGRRARDRLRRRLAGAFVAIGVPQRRRTTSGWSDAPASSLGPSRRTSWVAQGVPRRRTCAGWSPSPPPEDPVRRRGRRAGPGRTARPRAPGAGSRPCARTPPACTRARRPGRP